MMTYVGLQDGHWKEDTKNESMTMTGMLYWKLNLILFNYENDLGNSSEDGTCILLKEVYRQIIVGYTIQ